MGLRGPTPKPKNILLMDGSRRAENRVDCPDASGRPFCPKWINRQSKALWKRLIPQLEKLRVLSEIDRVAVARYCQVYAHWRACEAEIGRLGYVMEVCDREGNTVTTKERPEVKLALQYSVQMLKLEQEFGLTPSARSRIHVTPAKPSKDSLEEFNKPMEKQA